jgi:nitrogen fixation NifU-like protein
MTDDHLSELYQEIILGHNRRPRNKGELVPFDGRGEGFNPTCGDEVTVFVRRARDGDVLEAVRFTGEGCAISQASASIMTVGMAGKSAAEARAELRRVLGMLTGPADPESVELDEWGDLAALVGVRKFPARIKCATLAWHALEEALGEGATVKG